MDCAILSVRIHSRCLLPLVTALLVSAQPPVGANCNRYNRFPTGANVHETALNSQNVNGVRFGKLCAYYVDGAVYAQPLYKRLQMPGRGARNVLYLATMNDKVYAYDADEPGAPLWMRDFTNEPAGIPPVPITDLTNDNDLNLVGNVGIESTPVIDPATNSLYLMARTKESGRYVQRLHRLDLQNGSDKVPPAEIGASVKGSARDAINGFVHFNPKAGNQRPALAQDKGQILIAWASHEDLRPYHGWIMSYDANTLKQTGALCMTPDLADGGIWQSGRGPAIDEAGAAYFEVGNGGWDGTRNFGNSVIKVHVGEDGLSVEDFYTPQNYKDLNRRDADVGSSGPLLVPGTDVLLCGDKLGALFLLSAEHLGHLTPDDQGIRQSVALNGGRVMAGPSFWNSPDGPAILLWTETDLPKAFRFHGTSMDMKPFAKGSVASHGSPGGALTISSDGAKPDTGVLWATVTNGKSADHGNAAGVLHAFNAENLEEIWNSEQHAKRDRLGTLVKFVPPLVANGKVYVPNYDDAVIVYGLLPVQAGDTTPKPPAISGKF